MKKFYFLIILALILGLVLTGCSLLSNVGQVPVTGQKGMPLSAAKLVALWHFDEGSGTIVYDSTTNDNYGTVTGASRDDGKLGKALNFDGTDDYVEIANEPNFDFESTDAFTLEAWVKTSSDAILNIITKMDNDPPHTGYQLIKHGSTEGNVLYFFLINNYGTGNMIRAYGSTNIADGQWHHVAVTYDGGSNVSGVQIYVDGNAETMGSTHNGLTGSILNDLPLQISGREGSNDAFSGLIDEVRIWDGALTATEIEYSFADEILHVDDDWDQWPGAYYTITEALTVAVPDDTIIVEAGTYPENVTIPPGKNGLQLIGAGSGVTSIAPTGGRPVTLLGWVGPIDGFRIQGFTLVTTDASHAFLAGSGTADGSTYNKNLEFEDIVVNGGQRGIGLNAVQGVTFDNVHLSNISSSPEAALELTGVSDLTFMGGSIEGNDIGVRLQISQGSWGDYGPNGNIQIHDSSLINNISAVENQDDTTTIDATCNWWGDFSGPSGEGPGSGDAVSTNVDFQPWLLNSAPESECGIGIKLDIKPQSCPNPLNVKSKGVLPVAILGTAYFDVALVDPDTIKLEGVPVLRWALEDVATPKEDDICNPAGEDGYTDLTLKFDVQEIIVALGEVFDGEVRTLKLTGTLFGVTTPIEGYDEIIIIKKGK